MALEQRDGLLLRIFISEQDRHEGLPLYEWLVRRALAEGLRGATVLRGVLGYGHSHELHAAKILSLSLDLPLVVEIVDTEERVQAFLEGLGPVLDEGLATVERLRFCVKPQAAESGGQSG